jgi:thiol:disulfide interchange protein DsbA
MRRVSAVIVSLMGLMASAAASAAGASFTEGHEYTLLNPAVPTTVPAGKIEVTEVFSYGCPACYHALPAVMQLKTSLPANAQLVYVPASFNPAEAWPMFQRAYLTAQVMGIAEAQHAAMFTAIWQSGELPLVEPATGRLRPKLPTIEDAARFYARHAGIKEAEFLATSKSFAVETRIGQAEQKVRGYKADSTPTFIVAGKYKVDLNTVRNYDAAVEVVRYLVALESGKK